MVPVQQWLEQVLGDAPIAIDAKPGGVSPPPAPLEYDGGAAPGGG